MEKNVWSHFHSGCVVAVIFWVFYFNVRGQRRIDDGSFPVSPHDVLRYERKSRFAVRSFVRLFDAIFITPPTKRHQFFCLTVNA